MRPAADAKAIEIQTEFELIKGVVHADPNRLQQIVWNLLSNAVKFTPNNGRVKIELRAVDSEIEICVRDSGEGIAPEHLPRLTERFYRVDAGRSRSVGGTGLGLAICKHIVERHRGRLRIASRVGEGTTVTVTLPASVS